MNICHEKTCFNPFTLEFLKWTFPDLYLALVMAIVVSMFFCCFFLHETRQLFPHQPLFKVSLKGGSLTQVSLYIKLLRLHSAILKSKHM